jgi:hypothetical protein
MTSPFCGAELLPHAEMPDGSLAPLVCTLPAHPVGSMHYNDEEGTSWQWQNADGSWAVPV